MIGKISPLKGLLGIGTRCVGCLQEGGQVEEEEEEEGGREVAPRPSGSSGHAARPCPGAARAEAAEGLSRPQRPALRLHLWRKQGREGRGAEAFTSSNPGETSAAAAAAVPSEIVPPLGLVR